MKLESKFQELTQSFKKAKQFTVPELGYVHTGSPKASEIIEMSTVNPIYTGTTKQLEMIDSLINDFYK